MLTHKESDVKYLLFRVVKKLQNIHTIKKIGTLRYFEVWYSDDTFNYHTSPRDSGHQKKYQGFFSNLNKF